MIETPRQRRVREMKQDQESQLKALAIDYKKTFGTAGGKHLITWLEDVREVEEGRIDPSNANQSHYQAGVMHGLRLVQQHITTLNNFK